METIRSPAASSRLRGATRIVLLALAAGGALATTACASDDGGGGTPAGAPTVARGQRGESCEFRNDCEEGLACVREICVLTDYAVDPTATDCRIIECRNERDCCSQGLDPNLCTQLSSECRAGDQFACNQFDQLCRCDESAWNCNDENRCEFVAACGTDADCPDTARRCVNRVCSQCGADTDCGGASVCRLGFCRAQCAERGDCPYFHDCREGVCEEDGCASDRECMAYLDSPLGRCAPDPVSGLNRCTLQCATDSECNADGYQFEACVTGQCQYVGCGSVEECRIFLHIPPGANTDVVCD